MLSKVFSSALPSMVFLAPNGGERAGGQTAVGAEASLQGAVTQASVTPVDAFVAVGSPATATVRSPDQEFSSMLGRFNAVGDSVGHFLKEECSYIITKPTYFVHYVGWVDESLTADVIAAQSGTDRALLEEMRVLIDSIKPDLERITAGETSFSINMFDRFRALHRRTAELTDSRFDERFAMSPEKLYSLMRDIDIDFSAKKVHLLDRLKAIAMGKYQPEDINDAEETFNKLYSHFEGIEYENYTESLGLSSMLAVQQILRDVRDPLIAFFSQARSGASQDLSAQLSPVFKEIGMMKKISSIAYSVYRDMTESYGIGPDGVNLMTRAAWLSAGKPRTESLMKPDMRRFDFTLEEVAAINLRAR